MDQSSKTLQAFEQAVAQGDNERYRLRLYVTGATPKSSMAIANTRRICETYLSARYELEVIDIYQQPPVVADEPIFAAPTLVKLWPLPLKRLIGDMSNLEKVLRGLGLPPIGGEVAT
ncbi:MAG: circadian clock KaiB family protein [Armatimonadota bacterium]